MCTSDPELRKREQSFRAMNVIDLGTQDLYPRLTADCPDITLPRCTFKCRHGGGPLMPWARIQLPALVVVKGKENKIEGKEIERDFSAS
jgi:hypothetical protein